MTTIKLYLRTEAASVTDQRTTVLKLKGIQIDGDKDAYVVPEELQPVWTHTDLVKKPAVKNAIESMKTRHLNPIAKVKLKDEEHKNYFDEDDNPCIAGTYLNLSTSELLPPTSDKTTKQEEKVPENSRKSLQSITKDFVLEKFDGKTISGSSWLTMFEEECHR